MVNISAAVGNPAGMGKMPVNCPSDVMIVKKLLYAIPPAEGGPGQSDWAYCSPDSRDGFQPRLTTLILNFQLKRKSKGVGLQGEETAGGRVMPGSATLKELERVSTISALNIKSTCAMGPVIVTPQVSTMNPQDSGPVGQVDRPGTLDKFIESLTGKQTGWSISGGASASIGLEEFGIGAGSITVTRPDGTNFSLYTKNGSLGISLAPGSLSFSGPNTSGGAIGTVYANGSGKMTDSDFAGPYVSVSGSVTICGSLAGTTPNGIGVSILLGGYGSIAPNWSRMTMLAYGDFTSLFFMLKSTARFICMFWGAQYGSPDLGASVGMGVATFPD